MAATQVTGLYRFGGEGEAHCGDCVVAELEGSATMRLSDWVEDEQGAVACNFCVAPVAKRAKRIAKFVVRSEYVSDYDKLEKESIQADQLKSAILDGIGYAIFIACIYIVLVVGGSL